MVITTERQVAGYSYQPTATELAAEAFSESLGVTLPFSETKAEGSWLVVVRNSTLGKISRNMFDVEYWRSLPPTDNKLLILPSEIKTNMAADETRRKMLLDPNFLPGSLERLAESIFLEVFDSTTNRNRILSIVYAREQIFLEDGKRNPRLYYSDSLILINRRHMREGQDLGPDGVLLPDWFSQIARGNNDSNMLTPLVRAEYSFSADTDPLQVTGLMRIYLEDYIAKLNPNLKVS